MILVRHKQQSETWFVGSLQTIGEGEPMAKDVECELFAQAARHLSLVTQQKFGAQLLS
jgi:hypothetical protein